LHSLSPPGQPITRQARDVARSRDEYQHLQPLLDLYTTMSPDDPNRLDLRDRLVAGYLPVARHIARRFAHRGEPLEDLEQVASLGLFNALERYEPERGDSFLGYAVPTITGEVRRHFRDRAWSMRVPRRLKDLHVAVNRSAVELSQQLNRAPRPSDIATRLRISTDEVLEALQVAHAYHAESLNEALSAEANDATLQDMLGSSDAGIERFINSRALAPYLAALPPRECNILIMRFYGELTQSQIAARIGISQMQVSRLLARTLADLRDAVDQDQPPGTSSEDRPSSTSCRPRGTNTPTQVATGGSRTVPALSPLLVG
jgi:RNA polymerase sigma-B factor